MDTVRWGLIGAGDIVRKRVAPALRNAARSELATVCRANAELAEAAAHELGAGGWHADWRQLIDDEAIDAVYIATPVFLHAEQAIVAAEAGKHVLCEKPMGLNAAECRAMIEACSANGVRLGVAYYRHFYPVIRRIKQIVDSGEIGRVSAAFAAAFEHFDPAEDDPRHWFVEPAKSGGGPMMDFGCHRIEVLNNIFGQVDSVTGVVSNSVYKRDIEDTAIAVLHFASGTTASIAVTHATDAGRDSLEIVGTQGSIRVPLLNSGEVVVTTPAGERIENLPPHANLHQPLIEDFVDAVMSGRSPAVDGETGMRVAEILDKIYLR